MIDLQSRDKPAYANTVGWMAVGDDYNLMTSANERSPEHVNVVLDTPNLWVKEVGDHSNGKKWVVLAIFHD
jgi:hypothetical protein